MIGYNEPPSVIAEGIMTNVRRIIAVLAGLCLLPFAGVLFSALLAALLGCELNEGGTETCSVLGLDVGGVLSSLFVMGWMALITLPLLMGLLAVWAFLEGGVFWRRRRRDRKAEAGASSTSNESHSL
ncbi:MAG: hypothetical protein ABL907_14635 [Hyphomicrobium sp.]